MHPADEFAQIKAEMAALKARADELRQSFIEDAGRRRSNRYEVVVKHQSRRTFLREKLPPHILADQALWEEASSDVVTVREIVSIEDPAFQLVEEI